MELVIANAVDTYRANMALIQDPAVKQHEILDAYYIQDRALLWCGDCKIVVTSMPVPPVQVRYLQQAMGYARLENLSPSQPSDSLCEDVLRDRELWAALVERLRGQGEVPLITFSASAQVLALADALRREGLQITTPECPPADLLWTRDYLDSKAGFRRFFEAVRKRIPGVHLPEGAVAEGPAEAARLAARFLAEGRNCMCKPNNSQSGVGLMILRPGELSGDGRGRQREIQARIEADSQLMADVIVVEELVEMDRTVGGGSPSLEMRIPADPGRDVEFMYLCGQILTPEGYFFGVEMYDGVVGRALQRSLEAAGVAMAREMRRMGYVGIFDMDTVACTDGRIYAVEVNTRRTGGTHAHEAAEALYGPRYWERAAVISNNELGFTGQALDHPGLRELLGDLLFPVAGRREGIMPTIVTALADNRFGYIAFGPTIERARELERAMHQRLVASGRRLRA